MIKPKELEKHLMNKVVFDVFKDNSQKIISNWFKKQSNLELVIKNFFSVYGQKGVLVENRFLTYVSVLENYHRNNISIEETKKVLEDYFDNLKLKKYDGIESPNFQHRLIYIIHTSFINSNIDNIKKYTEILRDTRDFHTHLLDSKDKLSLTWQNISKANVLLENIIREILLKEIGIINFDKDLSDLPKIQTDKL